MHTEDYREVDYEKYCPTCKHKKESGYDSVCEECLSEPIKLYSQKPVKWEEQTKKQKRTESK